MDSGTLCARLWILRGETRKSHYCHYSLIIVIDRNGEFAPGPTAITALAVRAGRKQDLLTIPHNRSAHRPLRR